MYRCRQGPQRSNRRNVQNRTLSLADHLFIKWLGDREQAVYVYVDDPVPRPIGRRREVVGFIDGGVVYKNVYGAPFVQYVAGNMLHAEAIGHRNFE